MALSRSSLGLFLTLAALNACGSLPHGRTGAAPAGQSCIEAGRQVDSSFAVAQARRAVSQPGFSLEVSSLQAIRDQGVELGLLISLVADQPPVVGGGGLVWVDIETGCAIVLRRYE